jgi:hypothetical protein
MTPTTAITQSCSLSIAFEAPQFAFSRALLMVTKDEYCIYEITHNGNGVAMILLHNNYPLTAEDKAVIAERKSQMSEAVKRGQSLLPLFDEHLLIVKQLSEPLMITSTRASVP